jgi:hypothetical protein
MNMRISKLYGHFFCIGLFSLPLAAFSQVTVTGPTCVIPGTVYQYLISGPWDSASTMQVCLTGGVIAGTSMTCTPNGQPQSAVLVTWNAGSTVSLQITSSKGNGTLSVALTDTLGGGTIAPTTKSQRILFNALPTVISCSPATGGSCSPTYTYQWQQSYNILIWTDIPGATSQNLLLAQPLKQTIFVRRQVTETGSGTISYSDAALVDVGAPAPAAVSKNTKSKWNDKTMDMAYGKITPTLKLF